MKSIGLVLASLFLAGSAAMAGPAITPLRVVLTVSRYDGEKRIGSLPYTLQVAANDARGFKVRMGVEVPVPVTTFSPSQAAGSSPSPTTSYQYKNVGTNIDCTAESLEDGRFRLFVIVEQSSLASAPEGKPAQAMPMFRTFNSMVPLVLRDGQTTQYVAATDPVTGESVRIDVALSVIK